jgi:hypothetical protein
MRTVALLGLLCRSRFSRVETFNAYCFPLTSLEIEVAVSTILRQIRRDVGDAKGTSLMAMLLWARALNVCSHSIPAAAIQIILPPATAQRQKYLGTGRTNLLLLLFSLARLHIMTRSSSSSSTLRCAALSSPTPTTPPLPSLPEC